MATGTLRSRLQHMAGSSDSVAARLRRRRFEHIRSMLATVPKPYTMLDVGGTEGFWETVGMCGEPGVDIVLLNLRAEETKHSGMRAITGTGTDLSEFADNHFDVVFSNSVIEHVGGLADQRRMADEVRRVGRRYYVQTPNRYFPIEPHFFFPFFGVMPMGMRAFLVRHLALGWYSRIPDREESRRAVEGTQLLDRRELLAMFPDAQLVRERVGGLTKSLSVYGGDW